MHGGLLIFGEFMKSRIRVKEIAISPHEMVMVDEVLQEFFNQDGFELVDLKITEDDKGFIIALVCYRVDTSTEDPTCM